MLYDLFIDLTLGNGFMLYIAAVVISVCCLHSWYGSKAKSQSCIY